MGNRGTRPRPHAAAAVFRAAAGCWLCLGCASDPLSRPETIALAAAPGLQRTLRLELSPESSTRFGSHELWLDDLAWVFEELAVAAAVATTPEEPADLILRVLVEDAAEIGAGDVDGQGALLDFLAWSTVPLAPLWIPDVRCDPGLLARVSLEAPGSRGNALVDEAIAAPRLKTSQRERYPLVSWPTAGAILLPPFFFRGADRDHFDAAVAERVRLELATVIARAVKGVPIGPATELLRAPSLERVAGRWELSFQPGDGLFRLALRLEPSPWGADFPAPKPLELGPEELEASGRKRVPLDALLRARRGAAALLRAAALDREGRRQSYTLAIEEDAQ